MTPRAEVLTMTKKGLAEFLMELKRTQLRHQKPFETFVADMLKKFGRRTLDRKTAGDLKKFRESPEFQQDRYARYIDEMVVEWQKKQQAIADKIRNAPPPTSEDFGPLIDWQYRERTAQSHERQFHSVRFYLGDLNRDINGHRVIAYGTDMEKGEWLFNPDPLVISKEGNILNGQHRLLAVEGALADKLTDDRAPSFVVVWGVDKRAAILMDEARRSATDRRDIALRFARAHETRPAS